MPAQTNACPVCGKNDTIHKVSGVVASGQASGAFSGPTGGVVSVDGKWGTTGGYTTLSGTTVSLLASLLAPPLQPKLPTLGFADGVAVLLCVGLALVGTVFARASLGESDSIYSRLVQLVIALVLWTTAVLMLRSIVKMNRKARAEYPAKKQS